MNMSREDIVSILMQMNAYKKRNDWQGCLQAVDAVKTIPEAMTQSYAVLGNLAFIYSQAAQDLEMHNQYIQLAEKAALMAIEIPANSHRIQTIKVLAYIYYHEFHNYTALKRKLPDHQPVWDKAYCENKAVYYYELLMQEGVEDVKSSYRYAHLLEEAANIYREGSTMADSKTAFKKALRLYQQSMGEYTKMDEGDQKKSCRSYYIKAAYNAANCCISLMGAEQKLLYGYWFLNGYEGRRSADTAESLRWNLYRKNRVKQAAGYLNLARCEEGLPLTIAEDDLQRVSLQEARAEQAWDIYYRMGKIWDLIYQYQLMSTPEEAFARAEKYYQYACDIHLLRRIQGKPACAFSYPYESLMLLYILAQDKDKYEKAGKKYGRYFRCSSIQQEIYGIQWNIIDRKYDRARERLKRMKKEFRLKHKEQQKWQQLWDIIAAIQGEDVQVFAGQRTAAQVNILLGIQRYVKSRVAEQAGA